MTDERVDMADPDNLLFLDTEAVNSSFASPPIEQNEAGHATDKQTDDSFNSVPDQHPDSAPGSSGLMLVSCQDGTIERHSTNIERENESGLVLTQTLDHTAMIEITLNHPNDDKTDDFGTAAVMETDNITNSINIPKEVIHLMDVDNMIDRNQNDKHSESNTKEDPNEAHDPPDVSLLTEHNRKEEMRQDTISNQYASFESTGLEVSHMANEKSSCLIASNETDATFSETLIQTCQDASGGVDVAVAGVTACTSHPEMHDIAEDLTCWGFITSQIPKREDPKTGVHPSLADLHEADTLNILTHNSTLLDPLMSPEVPLLTENNGEEMSQDASLNQHAYIESIGLEVNQMADDDDPLVNSVSDLMDSEQSLIASNKTDATSSETLIWMCQDTSEGVDVAVEAATAYKTHPEMHDIAEDLTCWGFTTSEIPKREDPKTAVHPSLADLHEADTLNILTHDSTLLDPLMSPEFSLLTENSREEMSQDANLNQYAYIKSIGLEVNQMADDDDPLVNSVSDLMKSEQSSCLTARNKTDSTSSKTLIQTRWNTSESLGVAVEAATAYKTHSEMHDIAEDMTCFGFSTKNPKTDVQLSSAELHKADTLNILTHASALLDTLMSPEAPLLTEHNKQEEKSQDTNLNQSASFKCIGLEVTASDVMESEQSSCLIASNETDATYSETLIQTCQDASEGIDVAVEVISASKTHPVMPDFAEDLTCCGFTTSQTEDSKTGFQLSLAELHKADTLNILTHASTLLDTLGLNNNVLETADMPVNDSEIILTVRQDLASSNVEFSTGVLTQTVQNLLQDSKHDVTESKFSKTEDSMLDRMIETKFPLNTSRVQPLATSSNDPVETTNNSESPFPQSMHETSKIGEKHEDLSQVIPCPATVTIRDLGNCSEEIDGACLKFTGTERDFEAGSELWLDACQFLAGEEDGGAIFDKRGRSCPPSPSTAHPDNTKASDYSKRRNISIDHHTEDWELRFPPVERWSSSDSWASALSDWFQAVNTYSEDSLTSSTGPKHGMAIQDNILEQRTSPDNANNAGQTCLSFNLLEPEEPGQALSRGLVESDNTNGALFKQGDKDGLPPHSDSNKQDITNRTLENNISLLQSSESHKPDKNAGMHMPNVSKSPANEDSAKLHGGQQIPGELWSAKSEVNALVEVTEDQVFQLGLVFEEQSERSFTSQKISASKNLTDCVSGEERRHGSDVALRTCPSQSNSHVSSEAGRAKGNHSFGHFNTEDCTVKPREEERKIVPPIIMPFAPLKTRNTFLHHSSLKSPQAGLVCQPKGIINKIHSKSGQKSISSEDSSEERFHTCGDLYDPSIKDTRRKAEFSDTCDISKELSNLILLTGQRFVVSEDKNVAYVTLDLEEPSLSHFSLSNCEERPKIDNMPHKTSKTSSDGKTRSKHKEKPAEKQQLGIQGLKKQDLQPPSQVKDELNSEGDENRPVAVIETIVITEKIVPKPQVKKKKKHGVPKPENDPPSDTGSRSAQKSLDVKVASNGMDKPASHLPTKLDVINKDSTQKVMSVRPKVDPSFAAKMDSGSVNATQKATAIKLKVDAGNAAKMENKTCTSESPSTCLPGMLNDDVKRRRIADDLSGAVPIRTRPQLPAIFRQARKDGEDTNRRAYSEVVKQKTPVAKEVVVPRVVSEIQADPVPADPQNISLWCQFSPVPPDATVRWTKEGTVLSEINKLEKDDGRFTLNILKACSKDLGLYKCSLNAANISLSTSEYHLTSEVLMELVIPSHDQPAVLILFIHLPAEPRVMDGDEENIQCSPLLFKDDFLSDQYFGEHQPASIVTEKVHFGEGMHRKAFRTTLREGNLPSFNPGHPCVLKVHNAISYGTKNNEELVQKNYSLAVEECHVQNTAREYIKAYNSVAKSAESFGEVPEIIPIYLVHRPSNNIPYATLEEELLGDFVKYSVKDGKEINLMRRDSEAGQKCCAFQHWVYTQTEGNLLVTDMQGVGMKLTDVGISTCKKGGNCATSFIDQFKALHQCNRYCELLGLMSLQPKPKRSVAPPKPKTQPAPKKKTFGSVLNAKS
ncbi:Alpha-protein kinase 2 [Labeo rohita]|uniref:non-specific serine/threonine protein kinase n=1 Tax=Labeo rohita TaxID=84645 RepID=A0ABQ8LLK1_LABRO|nr:Alpha-protein kinase 2 [Labeo rohita]